MSPRPKVKKEQAPNGQWIPEDPESREYTRSGHHTVLRAMPFLMDRVRDVVGTPDAALSPIELLAREWRQEVLSDLGGPDVVSATGRALVDATAGTRILLLSLDQFVFRLASIDGLVNKKYRKVYAVVADRNRVADSLTRQLQALGLTKVPKPPQSLAELLGKPDPEKPAAKPVTPEPPASEQPPDVAPEAPA